MATSHVGLVCYVDKVAIYFWGLVATVVFTLCNAVLFVVGAGSTWVYYVSIDSGIASEYFYGLLSFQNTVTIPRSPATTVVRRRITPTVTLYPEIQHALHHSPHPKPLLARRLHRWMVLPAGTHAARVWARSL